MRAVRLKADERGGAEKSGVQETVLQSDACGGGGKILGKSCIKSIKESAD